MYIIGVFRRTALWGIFLMILGTIAMDNTGLLYFLPYLIGVYLLVVLIHLLACKVKKVRRSAGESYFSALRADLTAPFSKIGMFIAVLTKRWIIDDDSKFHNFVDAFLVVAGGIWAIAIWVAAIFFILRIALT